MEAKLVSLGEVKGKGWQAPGPPYREAGKVEVRGGGEGGGYGLPQEEAGGSHYQCSMFLPAKIWAMFENLNKLCFKGYFFLEKLNYVFNI